MATFSTSAPLRKVAIYIRVSTPEQKQDGYSPEHQKKRLLAYIHENKGLNLTTEPELIFEDVGTGSNLNRPALEKIRVLVKKKKIQGVLVWKIDRLSRNLKHLLVLFEEMQQNEVSFISIQENIDFSGPIGRLIFQMFGAIAQFERELIRGRTYAGKLASAELGNYTGAGVPYGYKKVSNDGGAKGSTLEIIAEEQKWVAQIYDWYVYEHMGDLKIADKLKGLGVRYRSSGSSRKTSTWTEKIINGILKNPIYFGKHVAIKKDEEGRTLKAVEQTVAWFPACVSEVLYLQAQKARSTRLGGHSKHSYMLTGKLFDVSPELPEPRRMCGAKRTKGGFSYRRKRFTDNTDVTYPNFEIPAAALEDFVWHKILSAFKDPAAFVKKYVQLEKNEHDSTEKLESQLKALRKRETEIADLELPNAETALLRGVFSEEQFKAKSMAYEEELNDLADQVQRLEEDVQGLVWVKSEIKNLKVASKAVTKKVENLSYDQKQILCGLFIDRIEINKLEQPQKKRQVTADIFFRFNLQRLSDDPHEVCTHKTRLECTENTPREGVTELNGGVGRRGYLTLKMCVSSNKHLKIRHKSQQHYPHQTLMWSEVKAA